MKYFRPALGYRTYLIQKQRFSVGASLKHFWEGNWAHSAVKDSYSCACILLRCQLVIAFQFNGSGHPGKEKKPHEVTRYRARLTTENWGYWPQLPQCDSYLTARMLGDPSWPWSIWLYLKLQCTVVEFDKNQTRRYFDVKATPSCKNGPLFLFSVCDGAITSCFVTCGTLLLC